MMTSRPIDPTDKELLHASLTDDRYHTTTTTDFFYAPGSVCNVYEDEQGPVLFCRGSKALRLDIQFVNNRDFRRNRDVLINGFPNMMEKARANGFTEIIFCSNSPLLVRFCKHTLGFTDVDGELRLIL